MDRPVIPIRPLAAASAADEAHSSASAGCHGCTAGSDAPACQALVGQPLRPAELSGPPADLQRLLAALASTLGFPPDQPEVAGVRGLQVGAGEVALTLASAPGCAGSAVLTDAAFQTLRRLLPDTDIYIRHAA